MPVREIKSQVLGSSQGIGETASGYTGNHKRKPIDEMLVHPDCTSNHANVVGVTIRQVDKRIILALTARGAIELAKGILQNLPDMFVAADDELVKILEVTIGQVRQQAAAVVSAITRNQTPEAKGDKS